ncbi:hypothetical protein F5I97DRAFT_1937701 [Phlebopus sp. FC_14]|nr:hypothetical protein F5I97DRAFT_1937701 [Phlebopus sp. FC_14]
MKVAVIGSGVSGLAATWLLNEYSDHEVHLFEADERAGGHANTVRYNAAGVDVDIVFNPSTYPNFLRFLKLYPDITILAAKMTFSVSRDNGLFEWAGKNLATFFCQPSRLLDLDMWRLLYDILRDTSDTFRDDYLIPMTAAIWSTPPDKCLLEFPARTLVRFMSNHHLLQITGKLSWLTIKGGSRRYVDAILSKLPANQLHLSTPIESVGNAPRNDNDGAVQVQVKPRDGESIVFDRIIMACHSDTALALLRAGKGMTETEALVLHRFQWNRNEVVLHGDVGLMPKRRTAWCSWNYLTSSSVDEEGRRKANIGKVALTYYLNELQHLPEEKYGPILVTLNPPQEPEPESVIARFRYDHPVLNREASRPPNSRSRLRPIRYSPAKALISQIQISSIQNRRGLIFAGAWLGYGFHEDGFTSGLRAVLDHIDGVCCPFEVV